MSDERHHAKEARRHLKALGYDLDEVAKLLPLLAPGKPGSPKKGNDESFLEGLECHLRNVMVQAGLKRRPALQLIAGGIYRVLKNEHTGQDDRQIAAASPEALADRWERKLRKGGFHKRQRETLKPYGDGVLLPFLRSLYPAGD